MVGTCALCKKQAELKLSHIIPKFVFRYLKKDSFTGRLRRISDPNVPQQDGDKLEMLCGECEGRFSLNETHFANKMYSPFKKDGFHGLPYEGNWLHYFITSVNWRTLVLDIEAFENDDDEKGKITDKQLANLKRHEEIMRSYLLGQRKDIFSIENHIFFFDTIKSAGSNVAQLNPYSILHGSGFGYTVINDSGATYVFANLTGIIIVSIIKKHSLERWKNTYVKLDSGKIKVPQMVDNSPIFSELFFLAEQREEFIRGLSDKQREQLLAKIENDPEGFKASGTYKRKMEDQRLKEVEE
ncbi:hypothetical protein QIH01_19935 [Brevibacillus brevis]|nr:hypothetical protein QIH01_19935 [Brevibacillus brevis]